MNPRQVVHNEEHGAVVIWWGPKVAKATVDQLELDRFALYVFDYGAPVGYRMASARPERVSAIVSQNGNAYLDGFSPACRVIWKPSV